MEETTELEKEIIRCGALCRPKDSTLEKVLAVYEVTADYEGWGAATSTEACHLLELGTVDEPDYGTLRDFRAGLMREGRLAVRPHPDGILGPFGPINQYMVIRGALCEEQREALIQIEEMVGEPRTVPACLGNPGAKQIEKVMACLGMWGGYRELHDPIARLCEIPKARLQQNLAQLVTNERLVKCETGYLAVVIDLTPDQRAALYSAFQNRRRPEKIQKLIDADRARWWADKEREAAARVERPDPVWTEGTERLTKTDRYLPDTDVIKPQEPVWSPPKTIQSPQKMREAEAERKRRLAELDALRGPAVGDDEDRPALARRGAIEVDDEPDDESTEERDR